MGFWDKLFGKKNKTSDAEKPREREREREKEEPKGQMAQTEKKEEERVPAQETVPLPEGTDNRKDADTERGENPAWQEPVAEPLRQQTAVEEALPEDDKGDADTIQIVENAEDIQEQGEKAPLTAETAAPDKLSYVAVDDRLQKRLDTYFARLRDIYPDGTISHFNTGHKKLAERGAELRRLLNMEGDLDGFFALGGFTYQRSNGGRPPLPLTDEDEKAVISRIKALFPNGVPVVMAVREADHRLYLNLRALARRDNLTVGDYLRANGCMPSAEKEKKRERETVGVS